MKKRQMEDDPRQEALRAIEDGESKIREAIAVIDAALAKVESPARVTHVQSRVLKIRA